MLRPHRRFVASVHGAEVDEIVFLMMLIGETAGAPKFASKMHFDMMHRAVWNGRVVGLPAEYPVHKSRHRETLQH